jgi:hypothetical protein
MEAPLCNGQEISTAARNYSLSATVDNAAL